MNIFAGIVSPTGDALPREIEREIFQAVARAGASNIDVARVDGAVFARTGSNPLVGALEIQCRRGGKSLFAALSRLDNRDELARSLALPQAEAARISDAELLARMYERRSDEGVAQCIGAFSFAHWDVNLRRLILGRDCRGERILMFHRAERVTFFSNDLGVLLSLPGVPREIDKVALAQLMVLNHRDPRRTLYRGIERVPKRALVAIDKSGAPHRFYWTPDLDGRPLYKRDEDYVERARELFDQAVLAATAGSGDVAIATTGGLDSSAIAATAARQGRADRITCYTLTAPDNLAVEAGPHVYLHERDKVLALGRMYPGLDLRILAPDGPHALHENDISHIKRACLPALGPLTMGYASFMNDAVHAAGHELFLLGTAGNLGLSWTGPFSLLTELRAGKFQAFARDLTAVARRDGTSVARALISNLLIPGAPASLRRLSTRLRGRDPDSPERYTALNPNFIRGFDLARSWREQGFDPWFQPSGWNPARVRFERLFCNEPSVNNGLAWHNEAYAFAVRNPHADRRLLEFALRVPEHLYRRDGVPRSFARAVFADRLPREIVQEHRRGSGYPAWFGTVIAQKAIFAEEVERLQNSTTASEILDLPRLKRMIADWPSDQNAAERHATLYQSVLPRAVHVGRFIRWVESGNY